MNLRVTYKVRNFHNSCGTTSLQRRPSSTERAYFHLHAGCHSGGLLPGVKRWCTFGHHKMLSVLPASSSSSITQYALCAQFIGNLNHTLIPDVTLFTCFVISYTPARVLSTRQSHHRTRLLEQRFGPHVLEQRSSFARKSKGAQFNKSHSFQKRFLLPCIRNLF
jgi:hypothetical protein